jgi:hypothetical protein
MGRWPGVDLPLKSERSAARLAHQSGGLGVPSSNLGAPTSKSLQYQTKICGSRWRCLPVCKPFADLFGNSSWTRRG